MKSALSRPREAPTLAAATALVSSLRLAVPSPPPPVQRIARSARCQVAAGAARRRVRPHPDSACSLPPSSATAAAPAPGIADRALSSAIATPIACTLRSSVVRSATPPWKPPRGAGVSARCRTEPPAFPAHSRHSCPRRAKLKASATTLRAQAKLRAHDDRCHSLHRHRAHSRRARRHQFRLAGGRADRARSGSDSARLHRR